MNANEIKVNETYWTKGTSSMGSFGAVQPEKVKILRPDPSPRFEGWFHAEFEDGGGVLCLHASSLRAERPDVR